jgi:hypothetical protein
MHPFPTCPTLFGAVPPARMKKSRLLLAMLILTAASFAYGQTSGNRLSTAPANQAAISSTEPAAGAVQLRQPSAATQATTQDQRSSLRPGSSVERDLLGLEILLPRPSEFEEYVNRLAFPNAVPQPDVPLLIRRLGTGLITGQNVGGEAIDYSPLVPPDYLISSGDEIMLVDVGFCGRRPAPVRRPLWAHHGAASWHHHGFWCALCRLACNISHRVAQTFKNFQLSVSLGQLRGVRVYVTGFVVRPGAYTVQRAVQHGQCRGARRGPFRFGQLSATSSCAAAMLWCPSWTSTTLLLNGDRSRPAGAGGRRDPCRPHRTAGRGHRQRQPPAVFELKPGETMVEALRMAGGFAAVADTGRMALNASTSARRACDPGRHGHKPVRPNCATVTCCAPSTP